MTNRTTLLLIDAGLSLTLGLLPGTLQAQEPKAQFNPAQHQQIEDMLRRATEQLKPQIDPSKFPFEPRIPPLDPRPQTPAWVEFLKNNSYLAAPIVAFIVAIIIYVLIIVCRIVLGLIHASCSCLDRDGDCVEGSSSGLAKRVSIVVLLLVIGLAIAYIVYTAVNDPR
jgi:hypothetical protein